MGNKLVIDNDSLGNIFKYYYFDRDNGGYITKKIIAFFIDKIIKGEIVVLDKVFAEFQNWGVKTPAKEEFEKQIKGYVEKTTTPDFLNDVNILINNHYISKAANGLTKDEIDIALQPYRDKYADLYLIAYCQYLTIIKETPTLITEESIKPDKKLIQKIPTICHSNSIVCKDLPYLIFEIYRDELKFKLSVKDAGAAVSA